MYMYTRMHDWKSDIYSRQSSAPENANTDKELPTNARFSHADNWRERCKDDCL